MAYFSNGSEGMYLDDQCATCIHAREDALCPIAAVQLEFNYDQHNKGNGDLKKAMSFLINDEGDCQMLPLIDEIRGKVNKNRKCFQRQLTFGDIEQIRALNEQG